MINEWLGSGTGYPPKTVTIPQNNSDYFIENGRKIVKSGTLITDATLGSGLLVNDVDITDGARVGSILMRGSYIESKLPIPLTDEQKTALAQQGLYAFKVDLNLRIVPIDDSEVLFGKTAGQLQSDIVIVDNEVKGTSKYVTGYTGFSSKVEEQSGNYLALMATAVNGATIKAKVIGGTSGQVTLDSDGMIVFRIKNNQQKLQFIASYDNKVMPIELSLANLTLNAQ